MSMYLSVTLCLYSLPEMTTPCDDSSSVTDGKRDMSIPNSAPMGKNC